MNYPNIPLSLYIHIPWCIRKCPYCDFNSHAVKNPIPEDAYIAKLLEDLQQDLLLTAHRPIQTIFFGGGTPSLFSAKSLDTLLNNINKFVNFANDIEITLEANPGTIDVKNFIGYHQAGINRLSIGIQSFDKTQLHNLGRIHDDNEAIHAIEIARSAGFENINLDLMFALPKQNTAEAIKDLQTAIDLNPTHISWYQLTLEPNTVFYKYPPPLPSDDHISEIQTAGQKLLAEHGYQQYEVSAYAKPNKQCQHNLNYWQFGDYLGIGAGAHGKITDLTNGKIHRTQKFKVPMAYMTKLNDPNNTIVVNQQDIIFEFMLNALRLQQDLDFALFTERTDLSVDLLMPILAHAKQKGFIEYSNRALHILPLGRQYLNDLVMLFLP